MADLEEQAGYVGDTAKNKAEEQVEINEQQKQKTMEEKTENLIIGSSNLTILVGGTYQIVDPQPASGTNQIIVVDANELESDVIFILPNSSIYDDGFSRNYYFISKGYSDYSVIITTPKVEKPNEPDYINGKQEIKIEQNVGLNVQKYTTGRYRATTC